MLQLSGKPHRKSRNGCAMCKARKVKCDEVRPLCGNCTRRGIDIESCRFANPRAYATSSSLRLFNSASVPQQLDNNSANLSQANPRRMLELKLLYHYTTSTWRNLPWSHDIRAKQTWKIDIPQLAFDNEAVLSILLALSALHLQSLTPWDDTLVFAAPFYFDRAITEHRQVLTQPERQSPETTLVTAILISQYTWLVSHNPRVEENYELPLQTYAIGLGIQSLFQQFWPSLKESGYIWFVEQPSINIAESAPSEDPFVESSARDLAQFLSRSITNDTNADEQAVWEGGSKYLAGVCNEIASRKSPYHVQCALATMPMRLPSQFLSLLAANDPRALALMARNYALIGLAEHAWWLHGGKGSQLAEINVRGIQKLMPSNWLWAMEWPLNIISKTFRLSG